MSKTWIISDTHFGHEKIIKYCGRPFENAELMDECIADNWNSVINDNDIVYHLGDVYFGSTPSFLYNLKGRKRLVLGNHDNAKDQSLQKVFEKIMVWRKWPEHGCILTHIPLHPSSLFNVNTGKWKFDKYINVHGHTHEKGSPEGDYVSACVEWHDYKPVELVDLLTKATIANLGDK